VFKSVDAKLIKTSIVCARR